MTTVDTLVAILDEQAQLALRPRSQEMLAEINSLNFD